ncbi:MAG: hypothetical protein ACRDGA_11980, partial [Bacteroidota bacterium]
MTRKNLFVFAFFMIYVFLSVAYAQEGFSNRKTINELLNPTPEKKDTTEKKGEPLSLSVRTGFKTGENGHPGTRPGWAIGLG